jgi:peptidoglycan/xylan/chitin deacetylase (PgdA/CDA1 family)
VSRAVRQECQPPRHDDAKKRKGTSGLREICWALLVAAGLSVLVGWPAGVASAQAGRRIALTFDDLPGVLQRPSLAALDEVNTRLLATLRIERVPAVGFVNEGQLDVAGEREGRIGLLKMWVGPTFTLGNHTYAHRGINDTPLAEYQADVLKGEAVTRRLLSEAGHRLVWFRHPYTHTGPTPEIRAALDGFLNAQGYTVAPFTVENADYAFAAVYERALLAGDQERADATMAAYLAHQDAMMAFAEALAFDTFGREIPQVLLAHVNRLNADAMPELLRRLRARGYQCVTLDSAVDDEAYRTPDRFVGRFGPSYLHRWRVALGKPSRVEQEPDPPAWVLAPGP